jgi:1-acyl-sn-glycerol-3-phosphate acyltransferase
MLFLRSLIFNICFYFWTAFCSLLAALGLLMQGTKHIERSAILWGKGVQKLLKYIVQIEYEIRGEEFLGEAPIIIASKHQSAWETTMMQVLRPGCAIVLKKELLWVPFLGAAVKKLNAIYVDRSRGGRILLQLVEQGKDRIKRGISIFIFPEGTRRGVNDEPHYRYGITALYENLDVAVVPAAHNAGYFWARRSFIKKPGKIIFEFLPRIEPGLASKEFMEKLQHTIETACKKLAPSACEPLPPHKSFFSLGTFVICLALLAGGGGAYYYIWKKMVGTLEQQVERYISLKEAEGFQIRHQGMQTGGFPLSVKLIFNHPTIKIEKLNNFESSVEESLMISSSVWSPQTIHFESRGAVRISQYLFDPEKTLRLDITHLKGSILSKAQEQTLGLFFDKALLYSQNTLLLEAANFKVETQKFTEKTEKDKNPYSVLLNTDKLSWQIKPLTALGNTLEDVRIKATLNTMGQGRSPRSVKDLAQAWFNEDGTFECEYFDFKWGDLTVKANGAFSLDGKLQPLVVFSAEVQNLEGFLNKMTAEKILTPQTGSLAKLGLSLFKQPSKNGKEDFYHKVSFTIQDGKLSIGPVDLFTVPSIPWKERS